MTDEVFGPFVLDEEVQAAIVDTVTTWMPTYLARIERKLELEAESLPLPASYALADHGALADIPDEQLPCVAVLCPMSGEKPPRQDSYGNNVVSYLLNLTAIVTGADQAAADLLASRYRKALELILVQQPSLGGLTEGVIFKGWRELALEPAEPRDVAARIAVFEVLVPNAVQAGAGLKAPRDEPYEQAEWPTVEEVDVSLEPTEAT
ncbi:MAG TPA: hypothetical protein VMS11_05430 [Solirubrobacterales bacterium]|nr:hypothetical protein [Solirubrobacterales bacterium]